MNKRKITTTNLPFMSLEDENAFRNYFSMLETLAENRDLQPNIQEAEKMLTEVDVTKFASYQWGRKAGIEQGIEQVALKLLKSTNWTDQAIAEITGSTIDRISELRKQLEH